MGKEHKEKVQVEREAQEQAQEEIWSSLKTWCSKRSFIAMENDFLVVGGLEPRWHNNTGMGAKMYVQTTIISLFSDFCYDYCCMMV